MNYYESINFVKTELTKYLTEIFKVYGNELSLKLEEYNLLTHKNNCIETSTAIGFILEEFITSKLEIYTQSHNNVSHLRVLRLENESTTKKSYDCYVIFNNILFMVNLKVEKRGAFNNAVSAINILHKDYVETNQEQEKSFIVTKVMYEFNQSAQDGERKIRIYNIDSYCLEEIDFSLGYKQDHRNWGREFKSSSGRLQISNNFRKQHTITNGDVSYEKTKDSINKMYMAK